MSFIRAYLRASTIEQDATRAKDSLISFATSKDKKIASFYIEHMSGRTLKRPKLLELLEESTSGDIILVESIDRLMRLTADDWKTLKGMIESKGLHIVALDIPTSHSFLKTDTKDALTDWILSAVNNMLLDILAVMACKDYELRIARAAQGAAKAKAEGKYKGRPVNVERNNSIAKMLSSGMTYSEIQTATKASRATIAKVKASMDV
jgi:DNA invertase Pin-like site-specific DNA recombinase